MTDKIASQLHEAYNNKGRTAKHLIPQGRIPDLGWNTDQQGTERQNLPNITPEAPVTQTTPEQVEGPPSSRLRSKTNIITPSNIMDPPKHNAKTVDQHKVLTQVNQVHTVPPKCNAKTVDQHKVLTQVNQVHTVHKTGFGWQTVVALTIIVNLIITLFLCFRI